MYGLNRLRFLLVREQVGPYLTEERFHAQVHPVPQTLFFFHSFIYCLALPTPSLTLAPTLFVTNQPSNQPTIHPTIQPQYFQQRSSGSFQTQREMLSLLANLLEMSRSDKEVLGLVAPLPRASTDGGTTNTSNNHNASNSETSTSNSGSSKGSSETGYWSQLLFGGEEEGLGEDWKIGG